MTRPSTDIERVVDSAAKALTALSGLASDLYVLSDSQSLSDNGRGTLRHHHTSVCVMAAKTKKIRRDLAELHEWVAWKEETGENK